jgi:hypothetical protein
MGRGTGCLATRRDFVEGGLTGVRGALDYVPISERASPYEADGWDLNLILSLSVFLKADNFISRRSLS